MTGTEISMILGQVAVLVTSVGGVFISLRNARKIDKVHHTTNSLAERNEVIAKSLGVAEGHADGLEEGRKEVGQ